MAPGRGHVTSNKKNVCAKKPPIKHENLQNVKVNFMYEEKMESKRNWVFATNSNSIIPISLQPDGVDLWYFKLKLFGLKWFIDWNIMGLRH